MTSEQLMEVNKGIGEWGLENVENIILIKNGVTNGDVIKAVFVNNVFAEAEYEDEEGVTWIDMISDNGMTFEMDWWNAPYQKGGTNDI